MIEYKIIDLKEIAKSLEIKCYFVEFKDYPQYCFSIRSFSDKSMLIINYKNYDYNPYDILRNISKWNIIKYNFESFFKINNADVQEMLLYNLDLFQ